MENAATPAAGPDRQFAASARNAQADAPAVYFDEIRSTSNTSVAFGGITPPAPRAP
jgi:hypothetical protein